MSYSIRKLLGTYWYNLNPLGMSMNEGEFAQFDNSQENALADYIIMIPNRHLDE